MNKKIIAFSGACGSGKSTLIRNIAKNVEGSVIIDDPIRDVLFEFGTNIVEARKNISLWCAIQRKVMNIRYANIDMCDADVILLDRAPADIMYYTDLITESNQGLRLDTRWQRLREEQKKHCDWLAKRIRTVVRVEPFKNVSDNVTGDHNRPNIGTYSNRLSEYGGIVSHEFCLDYVDEYNIERVNIEGKSHETIWNEINHIFIK